MTSTNLVSPNGVFSFSNQSNINNDFIPIDFLNRHVELEAEVRSLRQQLNQIKGKTTISPLEIDENVQLSLLDNGESVCSKFQTKLALPKSINFSPSQIPPEITTQIRRKAQQLGQNFQVFLFQTLIQLANQKPFNYPQILPGLSFTWNTLYHQLPNSIKCPKKDPLCIEIPLERQNCKCHLIYSIPQVCLDLATFKDITVQFQNQNIQITPMTFLDYGFLHQLLFTHPEQTSRVTRKLAICIQNFFSFPTIESCQVIIQSKMPEWTPLGTLIPAQHIMQVTPSYLLDHHNFSLLGNEFPTWHCSDTIPHQISNFIAYQIASHIGDTNSFTMYQHQFKLFAEDSIQKIRVINYNGEVPFRIFTYNQAKVQFFQDYINFEDDQNDDHSSNFWDNLSPTSLANLDNHRE